MRGPILWMLAAAVTILSSNITLGAEVSEYLPTLLSLINSNNEAKLSAEVESWFSSYPAQEKKRYSTFLTAYGYFKAKRWDAAEKEFQRLLALYPDFSDYALYYLGEISREKKEWQSAINYFEAIHKNHPESIWEGETYYYVATSYFESKQYEEALKTFKKYLKKYSRGANRAMAKYRIAICEEEIGDTKDAMESYKSLWINYPHESFANEVEQNMERLLAQVEFKKQRPTNEEAFERAKQLYKQQKLSKALIELMKLETSLKGEKEKKELRDDVKLHTAKTHIRLRDYEQAIEILLKLKRRHRNAKLYSTIANAYYLTGDEKRSLFWHRKVMSIFPSSEESKNSLHTIGGIYLRNGQYKQAIVHLKKFASTYKHSSEWQNAYWSLGWGYYLEGETEKALEIWNSIISDENNTSREKYWKAKALLKSGKTDEAMQLLQEIISNNPLSYYAILSDIQIRNTAPEQATESILAKNLQQQAKKITGSAKTHKTVPSILAENPHYQRSQILAEIGLWDLADKELRYLDRGLKTNSPVVQEYMAEAYQRVENYYRPLYTMTVPLKHYISSPPNGANSQFWKLAYPLAYWSHVKKFSEEYSVSPYLVLSLMRAESHFQSRVVSPAGALGLMQLMKPTAEQIAMKLKIEPFLFYEMENPQQNIQFGTYYIKRLLAQFDNQIFLTIPAYNAGPHRVKGWLSDKKDMAVDEFVEKIPFNETRNYVKRVIQNLGTYQYLYENNMDIGITPQITSKEPKLTLKVEDWS